MGMTYRTGTKSSRTLKYRINLGLPSTTPVYGVNTAYLLYVTVSYGVLRLNRVIPQGPVS